MRTIWWQILLADNAVDSVNPSFAEDHDKTQGHDTLGFLDKDRGSEEEGIFEKAKAALGAALPFVRRDQVLVGKNTGLKNIGSYDPTSIAKGLLSDLLLVDGDRCHDLP